METFREERHLWFWTLLRSPLHYLLYLPQTKIDILERRIYFTLHGNGNNDRGAMMHTDIHVSKKPTKSTTDKQVSLPQFSITVYINESLIYHQFKKNKYQTTNDWLIDWIEFYAVSAFFQLCNGGTTNI